MTIDALSRVSPRDADRAAPRLAVVHVLAGRSVADVAQLLSVQREGAATLVIVDAPIATALAAELRDVHVASTHEELRRWLSARPSITRFHVVPDGALADEAPWTEFSQPEDFVALSCPRVELPPIGNLATDPQPFAWHCSRGVIDDLVDHVPLADWSAPAIVRALQRSRRAVAWRSVPVASRIVDEHEAIARPAISTSSRVLAMIPHHECDDWLRLALASIVSQTRRPDAVVVVDDASSSSPRQLVSEFGEVTLLRSEQRCGPYAAIQRVIAATEFDAYLLQDADDISCSDRLERLLLEGERTGASLIGTQAIQLHWDTRLCSLFCTPQRISKQARQSDYSVLHPSSIVSRQLLRDLGGFSTGLVFGGDNELHHRARLTDAIIGNTTYASYIKIVHPRALTMTPETGFTSTARRELRETLQRRFAEMFDAAQAGARPNLTPFKTIEAPPLKRVCGPPLGPF